MHDTEPEELRPSDLARSLGALQRAQSLWLADVGQIERDTWPFVTAFRRWQEQLDALTLFLHRAESRLLHFLLAPPLAPPTTLALPTMDHRAVAQRWHEALQSAFTANHLATSYQRLATPLDLDQEAVVADITTDFVTVLETAETTMPALALVPNIRHLVDLEELAFYHIISPWKCRGHPALLDVRRWLAETIREHEAV